jgi:hypothetical protein
MVGFSIYKAYYISEQKTKRVDVYSLFVREYLQMGIGHLSEKNFFFSGGHLSENYFSFTCDFSRTLSEFHFIISYDIFRYEIKINHIKI